MIPLDVPKGPAILFVCLFVFSFIYLFLLLFIYLFIYFLSKEVRLAKVVGLCRESVVPERLRKPCYRALNGKNVLYNIVTCMYTSCFWHYPIFSWRSRGKKITKVSEQAVPWRGFKLALLRYAFFTSSNSLFGLLAALVHNRLLKPENNQNDEFGFSALFTYLNGNETVFQTCCLLLYPLIGNVFMHLFRQFIALVGWRFYTRSLKKYYLPIRPSLTAAGSIQTTVPIST